MQTTFEDKLERDSKTNFGAAIQRNTSLITENDDSRHRACEDDLRIKKIIPQAKKCKKCELIVLPIVEEHV